MTKNINTADYWNRTYQHDIDEGNRRLHPHVWTEVYKLLNPYTQSLADIGCGMGEFLIWLRAQRTNLDLIGVDHSQFAIDIAKHSAEIDFSLGYGGMTFLVGTAYDTRLNDEIVDVVYSGHLLEHLDDPVAALTEQYRILAPGGRLIVHFPYEDAPYVEHVHILNDDLVHRWVMAAATGGLFREGETPVIPGQPTNDKVIWYTKGEK